MKKISDPTEIRQALTRFAYKHNINMVTQFHNQIFVGINGTVEELEKSLENTNEKKEISDLKQSIHLYENYVLDNLRNFTLVMHLSNFEEISALTCREEGATIGGGSSIDRFKEGWKKKLAKPLGQIPAWCTLKDAAKIRNAILHASANISLNRDKNQILAIIQKENLNKKHGKFYVTEEYLNKVRDAIWEMVQ